MPPGRHLVRKRTLLCSLLAAAWLTACAAPLLDAGRTRQLEALLPAQMLLLGEQHDAPEHHRLERDVVHFLAGRAALAALVVEMAERGHDTRGLPPSASAAQVRKKLAWNDAGWPWAAYGPVVMAAVRAGVPVAGGNLPHAQLHAAMHDADLDAHLPVAALARQRERIREGHCNMLPEARIAPMTRMQIARDRALAQTLLQQRVPGRTVLLIAGNGHVVRDLGVPMHLPAQASVAAIVMQAGERPTDQPAPAADAVWVTPPTPPQDDCARLRALPAAHQE